ncbi:MAG TPA: hypothetical protein VGL92_16285 [Acidimicrobiia bacterium]|jgi:hypothetical protein
MPVLEVLDHGELIAYSFRDLLKYHGRGAIGGVAHGFKVMERALPLLAAGEPPERHDISVETAFEGRGARDAFEMVTRALTEGRYRVDRRRGAVPGGWRRRVWTGAIATTYSGAHPGVGEAWRWSQTR